MPQLSSDAFAFGGALLTVDAALAMIAARVPAIAGTQSIALPDADGRILARPLIAAIDLPRFDNSAVDGYAVNCADLASGGETILPVAGRIAAGHGAGHHARPGSAVRIFTGAPMPAGTDTVFMQEDVRVLDDARVALPGGLEAGANRRPRGEDIAAGGEAIAAGRRLQPHDIALAAALGCERLTVRRELAVALFSTGDEIVSPPDALPAAGLYDANRFALHALLRRRACRVTDLGIVRDEPAALAALLAAAARDHDLIVSSGGVSMGEEDYVRAAVENVGSLVFWRLAIKPGRPVAMGIIGGTPFIGLPGNPVAVFITYAFVVRPLLAALAGETRPAVMPLPVVAAFAHRKKAGRREFIRVRLERNPDGTATAHPHPVDGAGIITSLTQTDGLVEIPEPVVAVAPGDRLNFLAYDALF